MGLLFMCFTPYNNLIQKTNNITFYFYNTENPFEPNIN